MQYLRADTITEVTVGPAVAVGDGFTPVTGLVGTSADEFEIIKHGATATTTIAGTLAAITDADGYYALDLSATDTNTEGRLTLLINDDSLILPIRLEFMVVSQKVFDSLFAADGTDKLEVDAVQWLGGTIATPTQTGVPEVDITHVSGVAEDLPSNTDLNARTLASASYFDPATDTVANVTTVAGVTGLTTTTITNAVYDELTSESRTAGSYGQLFKDNINATISSRSSHGDPDPSGFIDAAISTGNSDIAAVKVVTDQFTFTVPNRADVNTRLINSAAVVGDGSDATPWDGA